LILSYSAWVPKNRIARVPARYWRAAVTHDRIEESRAHEITKAVLEHIPELTTALAAAKETSATNAAVGSSIPFHPGAVRYYKEKGITIPPT
jgi:TRAP-type uncharacterized transport system substrate-binding protein